MTQDEEKTFAGPDGVLQVRVGLVETNPQIWRLLEIRGLASLAQVHTILQAAFGWEDAHLHRFTASHPFAPLRPINGREVPEPVQWLPAQWCDEPTDLPEEDCSLQQLLAEGFGQAFYEYDFGDSWLHQLELISHKPAGPKTPVARLIDGSRRGPVEDCGGFPGYEALLDALADPSHPDHDEQSAWVVEMIGTGESFDPEFLDVAAVNRELSSLSSGAK